MLTTSEIASHNAAVDRRHAEAEARRKLLAALRDTAAIARRVPRVILDNDVLRTDASARAAADRARAAGRALARETPMQGILSDLRHSRALLATLSPQHVTARLRKKSTGGLMEFVASTEEVASDGLVIKKCAWDRTIERARQGVFPKFLAGHSHHSPDGSPPTIGKIERLHWEDRVGLVIGVRFAPEKVTPLGPRYAAAYEGGFMTDVSVSWINTVLAPEREWADRHTPEIVSLLCDEISCVTVGADTGAKARI